MLLAAALARVRAMASTPFAAGIGASDWTKVARSLEHEGTAVLSGLITPGQGARRASIASICGIR